MRICDDVSQTLLSFVTVRTGYDSSGKDVVLARRPWARCLGRMGLRLSYLL